MEGGKSKSGAKKIDRKLSVTRPKFPVIKFGYPLEAPDFFLEYGYRKHYQYRKSETPNLTRVQYAKEMMKSGYQVWDKMTEEERAPYVKGAAEERERYDKYREEYSDRALKEYSEQRLAYIKCRDEAAAAAAQGKTYSHVTDDSGTTSESEIQSEEAAAGEEGSNLKGIANGIIGLSVA